MKALASRFPQSTHAMPLTCGAATLAKLKGGSFQDISDLGRGPVAPTAISAVMARTQSHDGY